MAKTRIKFTYQDYLLLPEDKRYELIEGEFFMVPSPSFGHQSISRNLVDILWKFVREKDLGVILYAPLDILLSKEDVVQPDILFISKQRSNIITEQNIQGAPDLVVEILSLTHAERDRTLKRKLYAKYGVNEYWLVDPEKKTVEVLVLREEGFETTGLYSKESSLQSPLLEGLSLDLRGVFRDK